jgi:hypothetical protein
MKDTTFSRLRYAAIAVVVASVVIFALKNQSKPPETFTGPPGSVYYTGPMLNKQGGFGNAAGQIVSGPPKKPSSDKFRQDLLEIEDL